MYLNTLDKQGFYSHLGYTPCGPVVSLGANASRVSQQFVSIETVDCQHSEKKIKSTQEVKIKPLVNWTGQDKMRKLSRKSFFLSYVQYKKKVSLLIFCQLDALIKVGWLLPARSSKHPTRKRRVNWLFVYFCVVHSFEKEDFRRKFAYFVIQLKRVLYNLLCVSDIQLCHHRKRQPVIITYYIALYYIICDILFCDSYCPDRVNNVVSIRAKQFVHFEHDP